MARLPSLPHGLLLAALGCTSQDHAFNKIVDPIPPEPTLTTLRVDLAMQENDYGAHVSRCQMQVAFEPIPEFTDPDASGEDTGEDTGLAEPKPEVALPSQPGECAFSEVPPAGPPPEGGGEGSMTGDNWQLSGDVVGPDSVEMWHNSESWTLDAVETEHGGLRYEWSDCSHDAYPFSRTLTLYAPPSEDPDGVDSFTMEELVPVGPRVVLDHPMGEHGGQPSADITQPLMVAWHLAGDLPTIEGEALTPDTLVKIKTQDQDGLEATRWLVCWPESEGFIELSPDILAPLFVDREDPELYRTNIDVHTELLSTERPTPWGEALTVRTNISMGTGLRHGPEDGEERGPPPE